MSSAKITAHKGSVVYADTDAIVNAANAQLAPGGGVCGAIFSAAGYDHLDRACRAIGGCPTGSAVTTPGFKLKAKYIIHAVGPIYRGTKANADQLYSAYQACLAQAEEHGCHSIGLCSISTGIYGYPLEEAVQIAVKALRDYPVKNCTDIRIYCFADREYQAFTHALSK